jgi:hypothetical protein
MDVSALGSVRRADLAVPQIQTTVPSGRAVAKNAKCLLSRDPLSAPVKVATSEADLGLLELYSIGSRKLVWYAHSEDFGNALPRAAYSFIREDLACSSSAMAAETTFSSDPAMAANAKHNGAANQSRLIRSPLRT